MENKGDNVFENLDDLREKMIILEEEIRPQLLEICEFGEMGKVAEGIYLIISTLF